MCRSVSTFLLVGFLAVGSPAAEPAAAPRVVADLAYKSGDGLTEYERTRCTLDLYLPAAAPQGGKGFPCLVWFHGGGLTEGHKRAAPTEEVAAALAGEGIAVAAVNYRLSPQARFPDYVEDAAEAFAWVRGNVAAHGGDPEAIFIGGHSAGAYLTTMLVVDPRYLEAAGERVENVAGAVPVAGQMVTHSTVREERGIARTTVVVDAAAPLHHCRKETPPILALYASDDLPCRAEENLLFAAAMRAAGNAGVTALRIDDRDHGTVAGKIAEEGDPAREAITVFVRAHAARRSAVAR